MNFYLISIFFLSLIIIYLLNYIKNLKYSFNLSLHERKQRQSCILEFEKYTLTLRFFQEKAFEIIYKDNILIYSLEGLKPNNEEFNILAKKFLKLFLKLMGPNLVQEYIYFFGSEESFYLNMIEFFNTRYEDDEIRKSSISDIVNDETPLEEDK